MRWRENSDLGTHSHVCRLAWPNSPNCAVGILLPAPLNSGSNGPKTSKIAKTGSVRKRAELGCLNAFYAPRGRNTPETHGSQRTHRGGWGWERCWQPGVRRRVYDGPNGHNGAQKLRSGRPYTRLPLGLGQFAELRRGRPPPHTHPFGPQSPKSAEIADIDPARKRADFGRPDELEGHVWRF